MAEFFPKFPIDSQDMLPTTEKYKGYKAEKPVLKFRKV